MRVIIQRVTAASVKVKELRPLTLAEVEELVELNNPRLQVLENQVEQAKSLEILLEEMNQQIELVLLLQIEDKELIDRLLLRGRDDDTKSVISNRLEVYHQKTAPLIDFYKAKGLLSTVEAEGNVDQITARIHSFLK